MTEKDEDPPAAAASTEQEPPKQEPSFPIQQQHPPSTPNRDDASAVSNITTDASVISRTSASIASVISQSMQILKGELPEEDRTDYVPPDDRPNPTKSISFGQIPMEFSGEDAETASLISIDFLQDSTKEMTYGRRIALALMNKKWYNPRAGEDEHVGEDHYDETTGQERGELVVDTTMNNGNHVAGPASPVSEGTRGYPAQVTQRQFPSLERAWGYFEHVALPRYIVEPKPDGPKKNILTRCIRKVFCKADKQLDKAEPGENHLPTRLYSPIFTPLKQMGGK